LCPTVIVNTASTINIPFVNDDLSKVTIQKISEEEMDNISLSSRFEP
jgi:hypothetical protein